MTLALGIAQEQVLRVGPGKIRRHMLYDFFARVYRRMITPLIRDAVLVEKFVDIHLYTGFEVWRMSEEKRGVIHRDLLCDRDE